MIKSIFTNTDFFNLSDPQPAWLYDVLFYKRITDEEKSSLVEQKHLFVDSITLPEFTTETVTKNYFGSEKTFPVLRTYGTDLELGFTIRSDWDDNKELYRIAQLNSRVLEQNYNTENNSNIYPVHPEIEECKKQNGTWWYLDIDKIEVRIKNKTANSLKRSGRTGFKLKNDIEENYSDSTEIFTFQNCVLTNFSFNSSLDYSSEEIIQCKLTYHSDIWTHSHNDVDTKK